MITECICINKNHNVMGNIKKGKKQALCKQTALNKAVGNKQALQIRKQALYTRALMQVDNHDVINLNTFPDK